MAIARLLLVGLLLSGCSLFEGGNTNGGAVAPPPASVGAGHGKVVIQGIAYNPARVEVPAGQELVWTVADNGLTHTVTADDGSFDSGRLASGEFRRAFTTSGEISYHCEVHARMKGTVVVK
ncbi:MAG: plastocyanin/azurin family copper-binding protein [Acidimicrobiia bacterium]